MAYLHVFSSYLVTHRYYTGMPLISP